MDNERINDVDVAVPPGVKRMYHNLIQKGMEEHEACLAMNAAMVLVYGGDMEPMLTMLHHMTLAHSSIMAAQAGASFFNIIELAYYHMDRVCRDWKEERPLDESYVRISSIRDNYQFFSKAVVAIAEKQGNLRDILQNQPGAPA